MVRILYALFWVALGGLSGFYLFTLLTDPTAAGRQIAQANEPQAAPEPSNPPPVVAAVPSPSVDSAEVDSLKGAVQDLSQRLATLDERLKPIERFIGPVAALPPSNSVSTSPPAPPAPEPQPVAAAPDPQPAPPPPPAPTPPPVPSAETGVEEAEETVVETPTPPPPAPPPVAAVSEPTPPPEPALQPSAPPEAAPESTAPTLEAGLQSAEVGCQLIKATNSAGSKASAARAAYQNAIVTANHVKRRRGWSYVTLRPRKVKPDPFWKSVRPVVTADMLLKPDVVTSKTYSQCWRGVVKPYVCTAGAMACGN